MTRYRYVGPAVMVELDAPATVNGKAVETGLTVNLAPGATVSFAVGRYFPRLVRKGHLMELPPEDKKSARTQLTEKTQHKKSGGAD